MSEQLTFIFIASDRVSACERFAPTAHANIRTLQDDLPVTLHFKSDDDRPAAVGFET